MTRGKYGTSAAIKREANETAASEAAYQRQIVRLTKERNEARSELAEVKKSSAAEARKLRAQISEGTSDLVAALRSELERFRSENDQWRRAVRESKKSDTKVFMRIADHMVSEHGLPRGREASERAIVLMFPEFAQVLTKGEHESKFIERYGEDIYRTIRAMREQRSAATKLARS